MCLLRVMLAVMIVHSGAGVKNTYGRHFVFPVPTCDVEYRPYLLVTSARKGLITELIISGLFTEIMRTNIAQFTRFDLPCRKLKTTGISRSGAIAVISSDDVMLHVTYHHDNFIVYPVSSLGSNYSIFLPRVSYQPASSEYFIAVTGISTKTDIQIRTQQQTSKIYFGKKLYRNGAIVNTVLNKSDVAMLTCRTCKLNIQGSEPFFVLVWNIIMKNTQKITVEQIRPINTWGKHYILPLPEWADDQVRISINTDHTSDVIIDFRTQTHQDQIICGAQGHVVTMATATDYIHLSASTPFHVMFLIRDAGSINDTFSLISGVPISQYMSMTCDVIKGQTGFTAVAYEEYIEETYTFDYDNSSTLFTNYSSRVNFTVIDNNPQGTGMPQLVIPFLKHVLGAYTVYLHKGNGRDQLISGGSKLRHPYHSCVNLNGTNSNDTLCLDETLNDKSESDIKNLDEESELSSFIGCMEPELRRHVTWTRGNPKERGITASVIAVIVSIVVAVVGVIGFIIGLVIIDLTDDQRPMRQSRVMPMEDDPPPPE